MDKGEIIMLVVITSPVWVVALVWWFCRLSSPVTVPTSREHLLSKFYHDDSIHRLCWKVISIMFDMGKGTSALKCLHDLCVRHDREHVISEMPLEDCDEIWAALQSVIEFHKNEEYEYYSQMLKGNK